MNVRSLSEVSGNLLHLFLKDYSKPSILCVLETWFSSNQPFKQFNLNDYKLVFSGNSNKCNKLAMLVRRNFFLEDK